MNWSRVSLTFVGGVSSYHIIVAGLLVSAVGLWYLLVRRWRKDWPTVDALVELRAPDRSWGWLHGELLYWGEKKEAWAVYSYSDKSQSCRITPTFSVTGGPFLLWTSKPRSNRISVRVNPNQPEYAYPADDGNGWPYIVIVGVLLVLTGVALSAN